MSRDGLEQMCSTAEELLAVLVGDTPQDIILNIHEMSRQITALRRKHEEQLKSDIKCWYACHSLITTIYYRFIEQIDSQHRHQYIINKIV